MRAHALVLCWTTLSLLALAGCTAPTAMTPQQALQKVPGLDAVNRDAPASQADTPLPGMAQVSAPAPAPTPMVTRPDPVPAIGQAPRLDTTDTDTFTQSLKRIDPTLNPSDQKLLRSALMLFTMRLQQKIGTIAQTYTSENPPQFTDKQLLDMAYGDLNGKTGAEIIQAGQDYYASLPPEARQAIAQAAQGRMPGGGSPRPAGL